MELAIYGLLFHIFFRKYIVFHIFRFPFRSVLYSLRLLLFLLSPMIIPLLSLSNSGACIHVQGAWHTVALSLSLACEFAKVIDRNLHN